MKFKTLFALSLISVLIFSGCAQKNTVAKTVKINMTISQYPEYSDTIYNVKSSIVEANLGEEFGPSQLYGLGSETRNRPFKFLEHIDQNRIKISFDNSLVIRGEPVGKATGGEMIVSKTESCFRTATLDSGSDICLKLV